MKIKGNSLVIIPDFIRKKYGEAGLTKWFDNLEEDASQFYASDINPTKWYDLDKYYLDPVKVYCDIFKKGNIKKGAFELGEADAANSLKGVYKIFIQMGSPEYLIKKAAILFPTYYKDALMNVKEISKGRSVLEITEFGGEKMKEINKYTIEGWMNQALKVCRVKNILLDVVEKNGKVNFIIEWG